MENIKHALYINLDSRKDRKEHVEKQLEKIGIKAERFNAIKMANGAIGCTMSHLRCIQTAKEKGWDHLLILEDDVEFLNPGLFKTQFNEFLNSNIEWDVVLLAGNNMPPFKQVCEYCVKISKCQTTTSYMVNGKYFDTLIQNIREGLALLMKNPQDHILYAIDKFWFRLQEKDNWYLITPLSVTQRQDYSDIENKITNYTNVMLDLDKKRFYMRQMEQVKTAMMQVSYMPTSKEQIEQLQVLQKMKRDIEEKLKVYEK